MTWQAFASVFATIFLAAVGDKTQLATVLFAADGKAGRRLVFVAAASALVLAAGIGVPIGAQLERFASPATLKRVAGVGFIAIGLRTLLSR